MLNYWKRIAGLGYVNLELDAGIYEREERFPNSIGESLTGLMYLVYSFRICRDYVIRQNQTEKSVHWLQQPPMSH